MFRRWACVITISIFLTATLLAATLSACSPVSASQNQEHISPTQIKTETVPSGYFELTVSHAEVYASVGEQVEIRCYVMCMIDTPVEISSVYVVLFDSTNSVIREQAMTPDYRGIYWPASTEYTVVGDEAYYQIKFNFSFITFVGESGEYTKSGGHTEYTARSFPIAVSQNQEPIEIVSVLGPVGPINPGGPGVEITLKNVGVEPVVSLTATLEVSSASGIPFDFAFDDITPSHPLQPNRSTSARLFLIAGGFISGNVSYPLTINATLQSGANFTLTKLVVILKPPLMPTSGWAIIAIGIAILVAAVIVLRRLRAAKNLAL